MQSVSSPLLYISLLESIENHFLADFAITSVTFSTVVIGNSDISVSTSLGNEQRELIVRLGMVRTHVCHWQWHPQWMREDVIRHYNSLGKFSGFLQRYRSKRLTVTVINLSKHAILDKILPIKTHSYLTKYSRPLEIISIRISTTLVCAP